MFQTPEALSPDKHPRLKLSSTPDYRFAASEVVCPIVAGEMWQVAREYIFVFQKQTGSLPLALLGTQPGVNDYLGDGAPPWLASYVPAHFRRYPFVVAPAPSLAGDTAAQQRFTVCIDSSAPQLSEVTGQPLFNEDGSGSKLLEMVQRALLNLQQDFGITQTLVKQIEEAGLLAEESLTIKSLDHAPIAINGFRIVDQAKLRDCAPDVLSQLAKTRALDLIYAHIGSLTNARDGLLARKASGAVVERATSESIDLDAFFGAENDTLKFH